MDSDATAGFARRHIGPRPSDLDQMLATVRAGSIDVLIDEAIPADIRLSESLKLPEAEDERQIVSRNGLLRVRYPGGYPSECL